MEKCRLCGSDKIIPDVPLLDHYGDTGIRSEQASVEVHGAPRAWVFTDSAEGKVSLSICGECGYAELRVSNPHELWMKYQKGKDS
jgi:hypothetical protein